MKFTFGHLYTLLIAGIFLGSFSGCSKKLNFGGQGTQPVSHEIWSELLGKYVNEQGKVNYKGFQQDSTKLNEYLTLLSKNPPNSKNWTENERLAYWINAYNAFTIQIVARHYPVASIRDISQGLNIPFVSTTWDIKFIQIGDERIDLNNIEHSVIRERFAEPRIHFALVCAASSCPFLRYEAFTGDSLDAQLTDQAQRFINNSQRNKISPDAVMLSKIFKWYKGDFTRNQSLIDYVNKYANTKINKEAAIDFLEYDWSLNE